MKRSRERRITRVPTVEWEYCGGLNCGVDVLRGEASRTARFVVRPSQLEMLLPAAVTEKTWQIALMKQTLQDGDVPRIIT
jgi:hypothetical protein